MQRGVPRIDEKIIREARFSGLLHDTGHGPFSHSSEQYFSVNEELEELKSATPKYRGSGGGEILTCLMIESEPFKKFLREIERAFSMDFDPLVVTGYISGSLGPKELYRSEMIHGPFDADKLDYMFRDGHYTGLQVPIDLDRLFLSIEPIMNASGDTVRLCGSSSATSPLMQIAFNKMMLFAGVYHHHKVRAVDCMLWSIFRLAEQLSSQLGGVLLKNPADYLRITDDQMLLPELCDNQVVKSLVSDVRDRRLWKRALVISRRTVPDKHYDSETGDGTFADMLALSEMKPAPINKRIEISESIALRAGIEKHLVWLDVPKPPKVGEAASMWISVQGEDEPIELREVMPIQQWVEIYANTRYTAHVFCPPEHRIAVNKASIEILGTDLGLSFLPSATNYAKMG